MIKISSSRQAAPYLQSRIGIRPIRIDTLLKNENVKVLEVKPLKGNMAKTGYDRPFRYTPRQSVDNIKRVAIRINDSVHNFDPEGVTVAAIDSAPDILPMLKKGKGITAAADTFGIKLKDVAESVKTKISQKVPIQRVLADRLKRKNVLESLLTGRSPSVIVKDPFRVAVERALSKPVQKTAQSTGALIPEPVKHIFIAGIPGSGKTTEANRLSKDTGLPVISLDGLPDKYRKKGSHWVHTEGVRRFLKENDLGTPHIIEGTQLLGLRPDETKQHDFRLVQAPREVIIDRLVARGWKDTKGTLLKGEDARKDASRLYDEMMSVSRIADMHKDTSRGASAPEPVQGVYQNELLNKTAYHADLSQDDAIAIVRAWRQYFRRQ
jgi:adenylate kinase family enzyme